MFLTSLAVHCDIRRTCTSTQQHCDGQRDTNMSKRTPATPTTPTEGVQRAQQEAEENAAKRKEEEQRKKVVIKQGKTTETPGTVPGGDRRKSEVSKAEETSEVEESKKHQKKKKKKKTDTTTTTTTTTPTTPAMEEKRAEVTQLEQPVILQGPSVDEMLQEEKEKGKKKEAEEFYVAEHPSTEEYSDTEANEELRKNKRRPPIRHPDAELFASRQEEAEQIEYDMKAHIAVNKVWGEGAALEYSELYKWTDRSEREEWIKRRKNDLIPTTNVAREVIQREGETQEEAKARLKTHRQQIYERYLTGGRMEFYTLTREEEERIQRETDQRREVKRKMNDASTRDKYSEEEAVEWWEREFMLGKVLRREWKMTDFQGPLAQQRKMEMEREKRAFMERDGRRKTTTRKRDPKDRIWKEIKMIRRQNDAYELRRELKEVERETKGAERRVTKWELESDEKERRITTPFKGRNMSNDTTIDDSVYEDNERGRKEEKEKERVVERERERGRDREKRREKEPETKKRRKAATEEKRGYSPRRRSDSESDREESPARGREKRKRGNTPITNERRGGESDE